MRMGGAGAYLDSRRSSAFATPVRGSLLGGPCGLASRDVLAGRSPGSAPRVPDRPAPGPGFYCPCHDSSFDASGTKASGPSPRPLDVLDTRVEDGFVLVRFQRFRQGIPEKVSVG